MSDEIAALTVELEPGAAKAMEREIQEEAEQAECAKEEAKKRRAEAKAAAERAAAADTEAARSAGGTGSFSSSYTEVRSIDTSGSNLNQRIMKGLRKGGTGDSKGAAAQQVDTGLRYDEIAKLAPAEQLEKLREKEALLRRAGGRGEEIAALAKRKAELKRTICASS